MAEDPKAAYRQAWIESDLRHRLSVRVVHRTLKQRMHAVGRVLPQYAERELADVRDRAALLSALPSHVAPVFVDGEYSYAESVTIPMTGWSFDAAAPLATLRFEAARADLDTHPLLAASSHGALQLATEVMLLLDGGPEPLRVWRYGLAARHTVAHGRRTIRMLRPEERPSLPGWHAISTDGAALLQLDAPAVGTDGLADVWHLSMLQLALPTAELYRRVAPRLASALLPAASSTAADVQQRAPMIPDGCKMLLAFHTLDGACVAGACFAAMLDVRPLQPPPTEHRRVRLLQASVRPASDTRVVELQACGFLPQVGIACCQLWQAGRVVLSTATHFGGALDGGAKWSLGEAVYEDTSGVTQREQMEGHIFTGRVRVSHDTGAEAALRESVVAPDDCGELTTEQDNAAALHWRLEGVELSLQLPWNADEQGVVFQPHACERAWTSQLRQLAMQLRA